jgi:hypothetical protein
VAESFSFSRQGRSRRTFVIVIAIYAICIAAIVVLDAAWWLMSLISLLTIPALMDLWFDTKSGLELTQTELKWFSGRRQGSLKLSEIDTMRFDTRWDLSVRVTALLAGKSKVRLPYETLPPHRQLETEFQARNVKVTRHHFVVI